MRRGGWPELPRRRISLAARVGRAVEEGEAGLDSVACSALRESWCVHWLCGGHIVKNLSTLNNFPIRAPIAEWLNGWGCYSG